MIHHRFSQINSEAKERIQDCTENRLREFQQLQSSFSEHWLRDSIALDILDSLFNHDHGNEDEISCGPSAFAALCGIPFSGLSTYFPDLTIRSWTNRRDMEKALHLLGIQFSKVSSNLPKAGLSLIHWKGPWTNKGFAPAILKQTHWIAVVNNYVFDVNWKKWLPFQVWEDIVVETLLDQVKHAQGWVPFTSYDLAF